MAPGPGRRISAARRHVTIVITVLPERIAFDGHVGAPSHLRDVGQPRVHCRGSLVKLGYEALALRVASLSARTSPSFALASSVPSIPGTLLDLS